MQVDNKIINCNRLRFANRGPCFNGVLKDKFTASLIVGGFVSICLPGQLGNSASEAPDYQSNRTVFGLCPTGAKEFRCIKSGRGVLVLLNSINHGVTLQLLVTELGKIDLVINSATIAA